MRIARPPSGFNIILSDVAKAALDAAAPGAPRLDEVWSGVCERLKFTAHREGDKLPNGQSILQIQGDPAFNMCFGRLLPLDWAELRDSDETAISIHNTAEQYGIGKQGISFPIRDPGFGEAMFSVNFECDDRHWGTVRNDLVNVFHLFAHYFHLRMKDVIAGSPYSADFDLSPREREVLGWAASGKTAWETATLIGVSERAIRLYTENAMAKLNAKTKTQAVAIAVRNGIIH